MTFARRIQQALLALSAGLALLAAPAAQAITITPLAQKVQLAPGADATLHFQFDFGSDPLALIAFDFALAFDGKQVAVQPADLSMSFSHGAPNLDGGTLESNLTPRGFHYSWATLGESPLPTVQGTGLLSFKVHNVALVAPSEVSLRLVYSTLEADDIEQLAGTFLAPVPEPASWTLALASIGCLLVLRRRGAAQA